MSKFLDVHDGFVGASQPQLDEAHKKDLQFQKAEGVMFISWWADPVSGKVFCLSEGSNKAAVLRVHEKAGHPTKEIYEIRLNGPIH